MPSTNPNWNRDMRKSPYFGKPPEETRFGKDGVKHGRGFWSIEETPRFKMEKMMRLTADEVKEIANNDEAPLFERRLAKSLLKENDFKITEAMINQVYGYPKQEVQQTVIEPPKPLSPRKQKKGK